MGDLHMTLTNLPAPIRIIDIDQFVDDVTQPVDLAAASAAQAALFSGPWLDDVASVLADRSLTYTAGLPSSVSAGDYVRTRAEGFSYRVADPGASDHHIITAGGVKLYVLAGLDGTFSVLAFGAVGDGVVDDTSTISVALASVSSGGDLFFPSGTYKITSAISQVFDDGVTVRLIGPNAKIDGTSVAGVVAGDTTLITLGGERLASSSLLSSSASRGDYSIILDSPVDAAATETVLIKSTDLFNATRPYYCKGELAKVRGVAGAELNLSSPLCDGYTAVTTTVHRLKMPNVEVFGLEVEMDANQLALKIQYANIARVQNANIHGARYTNMSFNYVYDAVALGNEGYDAWYSGTDTSYNIAFASCQNVLAFANNLREARHNISAGGNEPCRNVRYIANTTTLHPSETTGDLEFHGNCETCLVAHNTSTSLVFSGRNVTISDNIFAGRVNCAQIRYYQEISADYCRITGNKFNQKYVQDLIFISPAAPNLGIDDLDISDNYGISEGAGIRVRPALSGATGYSIGHLKLRGNRIKVRGASSTALIIYNNGAAEVDISSVQSCGNVFESEAYDAFYILTVSAVDKFLSEGDIFSGRRSNGYIVSVKAKYLVEFKNCYFKGAQENQRSVRIQDASVVRMISNFSTNMTHKAELERVGDYIESDYVTDSVTVVNSIGPARILSGYTSAGNAIAYGTAAPTTLTWERGDRVIQSQPLVGSPKGWMCTVSGTPGTWVSEGDL